MTGRTTRADRLAHPTTRDAVRAVAEAHGACLHPVQFRRINLETRETEHVLTTAEGQGSIASIRWRGFDPGRDTTTCLSCGQWRALGHGFSAPAQ